ncbi:MAG: ergothioneine biosynthesis protein EgtB [Pedobacter sp.]|nr:MAG: ergothioneine biosynthesis protein EgtB [Pedobacter sp.]
MNTAELLNHYKKVRLLSTAICASLETEDYVVQPIADVSPPKWHLGHTTWFFETFVLKDHMLGYIEFDPQYSFVFNSYYESVGARTIRTDRGNLSRPSVSQVYKYREYVDKLMSKLLSEKGLDLQLMSLIELGLQHEQQHQELLATDIKFILGHNPLFPTYSVPNSVSKRVVKDNGYIRIEEGIYEIGHSGKEFCFDNEMNRHKVYLDEFEISQNLVSNAEYLEFILSGGYSDFKYWHAEGWDWVNTNQITSPLYWHLIDNNWMNYTPDGLSPLDFDAAVCHVSYYEAAAFASWKQMRLPTESEWEIASEKINWGLRWEWTVSAYLPYPGFKTAKGAIGEYNGKFMVSQMVLRGASEATPNGHSRHTYRNFFHPKHQWQFSGIRLVR